MMRFLSCLPCMPQHSQAVLDNDVQAPLLDRPSQPGRLPQGRDGLPPRVAGAAPRRPVSAEAIRAEAASESYLSQPDFVAYIHQLKQKVAHKRAAVARQLNDPALHEKVDRRFQQMDDCMARLLQDCAPNVDPAQLHQIGRDAFKQLRRLCDEAKSAFSRRARTCSSSSDQYSDRAQEQAVFDGLAKMGLLFNEAKRYHYTHGANARMAAYATAKQWRMIKKNPGVALGRPGSDSTKSTELGIGIDVAHADPANAYGLTASYQMLKSRAPDQDADPMLQNTGILSVRVGFGHKFSLGKFFSIGIGIGLRASIEFGNYFSHTKMPDSIKAEVARKSESWQFLFRSGDVDSRAVRFCQMPSKAYRSLKYFFSFHRKSKPRTPAQWAERVKPNINGRKLRKGLVNGQHIADLTNRVFDDSGSWYADDKLLQFSAAIYQPVEIAGASHDDAPKKFTTPNPLTKLKPLGAPSNRYRPRWPFSIRRLNAAVDASANLKVMPFKNSSVGVVAGGEGDARGTRACIKLSRLRPSHELMNSRYSGGIQPSNDLYKQLLAKRREHPRLTLTKKLCADLDHKKNTLPDDPVQKATIRFTQLGESIQELTSLQAKLVGLAEKTRLLNAKENAHYFSQDDYGKHAREIEEFILQIFGPEILNNKQYLRSLKTKPKFFIKECYDAISIALGRVGLTITEEKEQAHDRMTEAQIRGIFPALQRTDAHYNYLDAAIKGVFLPIDQEKLLRSGLLKAPAISIASIKTWTGKVSASALLPFLSWLPGNTGEHSAPVSHPTGEVGFGPSASGGDKSAYGLTNLSTLAGIGWSRSSATRIATEHPNFLRIGNAHETRQSVKGVGVSAALLGQVLVSEHLPIKKFSRLNRARKLFFNEPQGHSTEAPGTLPSSKFAILLKGAQVVAQAETELQTTEVEIFHGWRKPPDEGENGKYKYKPSKQFSRFIGRKTVQHGATVVAPGLLLGIPMTIYAFFTRQRTTTKVGMEMLGTCPANHILIFSQLRDVLQRAHSSRSDGKQPDCPAYDPLSPATHCDYQKLLDYFNGHGVDGPDQVLDIADVDGPFMKHRYFFDPDSILGVLKDFQSYQATKPALGAQPPLLPNNEERTEFHRFDDNDDTRRLLSQLARAKSLGAGGCDPLLPATDGTSVEQFCNQNSNPDPRPVLSAYENQCIAEFESRLANPGISVDEVMNWLLKPGDDGGYTKGHVVFEAYCRICATYEHINGYVKSGVRYKASPA